MSTQLFGLAETGNSTLGVFALIRWADSNWWNTNTNAFEAFTAGDVSFYGIAATESGSTGVYTAANPDSTNAAARAILLKKAGATLVQSDLVNGVRWEEPVGYLQGDVEQWRASQPNALNSGLVQSDVERWGNSTFTTNVSGVPKVDLVDWLGSAPAALTTNGYLQSMLLRWLTDNAAGTPNALFNNLVQANPRMWGTDTVALTSDANDLPNVNAKDIGGGVQSVPGASGGIIINGANTGAITLGNLTTGTISTGNVTIGGTLTTTGAVALQSTLTITGATTFTGDVLLSGKYTVTGAASFGSTFGIHGAITADSTLTLTGAVSAPAGITANITGNLNGDVTGDLRGRGLGNTTTAFGGVFGQADVEKWLNQTPPATNQTGVPIVDLKYTKGTLSPAQAGYVATDQAAIGNATATVDLLGTTIKNLDNNPPGTLTPTAIWQDATAGDFTVSGSIGKSLYTSGNVPGAASGLLIAGSNASTTFASGSHFSGTVDTVTSVTDLTTTTYAEPTGVVAATATLKDKINWLVFLSRNKITQTSTVQTTYADNGTTVVSTATVSDDGITFTRAKFA